MMRALSWLAGLTLLAAAAPAAIATGTGTGSGGKLGRVDNNPAETANTPAAAKPAAAKPAAERPTAERPVAARPAAERPAAEEPAATPPPAARDAEVQEDPERAETPGRADTAPGEEYPQPERQPAPKPTLLGDATTWLAGGALLLLLLLADFLLFRRSDQRIKQLEVKLDILRSRLGRLESSQAPASTDDPRETLPLRAARIGGYDAGSSGWSDDAQASPASWQRTGPRPARPAVDHGAPPPPPRAPGPAAPLAALRDELARLIATPAMRMADYDALLRRHGTLYGYEVADENGSGRLTSIDGDLNRRLVALVLADDPIVALLPSARFVRDFVLYKERLEVGNDVKAVFDLEADGSAQLRVEELAHGRARSDGIVSNPTRGRLGGFLR